MQDVLLNELGADGLRRIRVIGDGPIEAEPFFGLIPREAEGLVTLSPSVDTLLGLHTLEITWPAREAFDWPSLPKFRRMVVWTVWEGERMRECICKAADKYERLFGGRPGFAFVGYLPAGAVEGEDVDGAPGCTLFHARWLPKRVVAVGGKIRS